MVVWARVKWPASDPTGDPTGEVVVEKPVPELSDEHVISVLDGFQEFEVKPQEQTSLVFRVSAKKDAGTADLTLRTLSYVQSDSRQVFLDPTTINIIVERKQEQK